MSVEFIPVVTSDGGLKDVKVSVDCDVGASVELSVVVLSTVPAVDDSVVLETVVCEVVG